MAQPQLQSDEKTELKTEITKLLMQVQKREPAKIIAMSLDRVIKRE